MTNRILDLLKFRLERFLLAGAQNRLIFIAILLLLVSLFGGLIVQKIDPELASLDKAVWWSFLRLSDPGYLGDDNGTTKRIVATIITVLGYVLFMGALVAIMTQWLHSTIRKLESGLTPISRNGHILILGWTNRTAPIIREILSSGGRLKRFLRHLNRRGLHVVILAPDVKPELTFELKEELGPLWNPSKITFRSGVPVRSEDLKRVDILHAAVIILPGKALYEEDVESIDAGTVKTLLSISNLAQQSNIPPPPLVTEIMDMTRTTIAEKAYTGKIEVINSIAILSRLICQSIRNPGMSHIYSELMTHEYGATLYIKNVPEFKDKHWSDIALAFSKAIPIGILEDGHLQRNVVLCPDMSFRIKENDNIIFVASHLEDTNLMQTAHPLVSPKEIRPNPVVSTTLKKILILGWSQKIPYLITELSRQECEEYEIDIVSVIATEERVKTLKDRVENLSNINIHHIESDYTLPNGIQNIQPETYDFVLFLASDWINSKEESDSRTILGYSLLEEALKNVQKHPETLIELIDPQNENLFAKRKGEVIISPRIISNLVGSITLKRELNGLFDELFSSGGSEFHFQKASNFNLSGPTSFQEIQAKVLDSGRIPFGIRSYSKSGQDINLTPFKTEQIDVGPDDDIIVLARGDDTK